MTFTKACMVFFGKEGRTLQRFAEEIKALTAKDREDMAPLLAKALGEPVE